MRFILISLLLTSCSSSCNPSALVDETAEPSPIHWTECGYEVGDHACDITLTDQNGKDWNLYENYGDVIVLDFSTEWCGYCHVAAEETQSVQDEKSDSFGFSYVTILVEDMGGNSPPTEEAVQRWSEHYSITAPVLAGNRDMVTEDLWNITGWPTFYVLNKDLVIVQIIRGYSADSLDQAIELAASEDTE